MIIKSIELGLMAEHLTAHKGILAKLHNYYCSAHNPELKQIIHDQFIIMRNHVGVMLMLIDPEINERVTVGELKKVQPIEFICREKGFPMRDRDIALEGRSTAKSMSEDNYLSALRMETLNIRHIHIQMAIQQTALQERYGNLIKKKRWADIPDASLGEQEKTLSLFKEMYNIK
ncbi:spore coat protein [Peribacillus frigoritolerans]|uniref:spore coat protein n=1 Tax=Peribacillus frigoritolerans TaxID=450367 RepID=UPI0039A2113F